MNKFKALILAAAVLVPMGAAQAADVDPVLPDDPAVAASGLYLRADAGWSFLEWAGGADDNNYVLGGGIGYKMENFRADVTLDRTGDYTIAPLSTINSTTLMANGYLDWDNDSVFTPYVGVGVGYNWVDNSKNGVALGFNTGMAVDLTQNLALDVGYRFRDTMISGAPDPKEHQLMAGFRFSF